MKWTEINVRTTEEAYDAVSEMFTSLGAGGVVIEDPNDIRRQIEAPGSLDYADPAFMANLGDVVTVKAYFHPDCEKERESLILTIKQRLSEISEFLETGEGYAGFSEIDEEDWSTAWKKYYKPFHISNHIVIKPSWEEYEEAADDMVIEMDPGMAFGTGTHETTRLCGQYLAEYVKPGDKVLDVGCGTGILAIIAAKLGAEHVEAVDIDEIAVRVAKENCSINGVQDKVSVSRGILSDVVQRENDIAVANIIADVIVGIAETIPLSLKPGGLFIASGIIRDRKAEVLSKYKACGFTEENLLELGEWVAIVFRCQGSL
jgi:ribosomal protein L11 methyltransferase